MLIRYRPYRSRGSSYSYVMAAGGVRAGWPLAAGAEAQPRAPTRGPAGIVGAAARARARSGVRS